jgi:hypothetical protein
VLTGLAVDFAQLGESLLAAGRTRYGRDQPGAFVVAQGVRGQAVRSATSAMVSRDAVGTILKV